MRRTLSGDDAPLPKRRQAAATPAASASPAAPAAQAGGRAGAAAAEGGGGRPVQGAADAEPAVLMPGKRRRHAVDYAVLNEQLFGGGMYESYAGEVDDGDFEAPGAKRAR